MKVRKKTLIGILLYAVVIIGINVIQYSEELNKVLAVLTMILSVIWVYECVNNTYLMIMSVFIAYSNYSIIMGIYLDESMRPKYLYPQITDIDVYGIGISVLLLVMLSLVCLTPRQFKNSFNISENFIKKENGNDILFGLMTIVFLFIIVIGYSEGHNTRGSSSALYEYGSIILILMFYFSGCKKSNNVICALMCLIYSLTSLLNGTRIEALMCILIFVLCYFKKGLKSSIMLIGMFVGIVVFSTVGVLRGNWNLLSNSGSIVVTEIFRNKLVFDTCTHAYFPMLCMIEEFKTFNIGMALHYLGAFVLSIFVGQSRVADGDLIQVMAQKYYHNYGGVTPGFFYVWFSFAGPAFFAIIVYSYIKFIEEAQKKASPVKCCALLYIVASVPRWYLYGPWSMTRGVLICVVIFSLISQLSKVMNTIKNRGEQSSA